MINNNIITCSVVFFYALGLQLTGATLNKILDFDVSENIKTTTIYISFTDSLSPEDLDVYQKNDSTCYLSIKKTSLYNKSILPTNNFKNIKSYNYVNLTNNLNLYLKFYKNYISYALDIQKKYIKITFFHNITSLKKLPKVLNNTLKVAIDAGHGGKDPGAVANNVLEKTITLSLALKLDSVLKQYKSINSYLIRDQDEFISLSERSRKAKNANCNLFISLHCNTHPQDSCSGFETYILSTSLTEKATAVTIRENSVIKYEQEDSIFQDEEFIIASVLQNNFFIRSKKLGNIVQNEISKISSFRNRGVHQGNLFLLYQTAMPAILFEAGFISNLKEKKQLESYNYQIQIVNAIKKAIILYLSYYENKAPK